MCAEQTSPEYRNTVFLPETDFPMRAGLPTRGSYEDRKSAYAKDTRFADFVPMLTRLVAARFSGKPLTNEEKKIILSIVKQTRARCLSGLSTWEKWKFHWKKL